MTFLSNLVHAKIALFDKLPVVTDLTQIDRWNYPYFMASK